MTGNLKKMLLLSGIAGIYCLYIGIQGILDKKRTDYYGYMNLLISGVFLCSLFIGTLVYIWYKMHDTRIVNDDVYTIVSIGWVSLTLFVSGIHGVLYKKKITNKLFDQISKGQLWGALIIFIALIFVSFVYVGQNGSLASPNSQNAKGGLK